MDPNTDNPNMNPDNPESVPFQDRPPQSVPPQSPPPGASNVPPPSQPIATGSQIPSEERTLAMLCHLLGLFTSFVGPLILWLIKKDESKFVDDQGKEALNFQITVAIAFAIAGALSFACIGLLLIPAVGIADLVFSIIAAVAANKGEAYRYPACIRLIK
jgi:uncharacterized protein